MTDARWEAIVDRIEQTFGIKNRGSRRTAEGGEVTWYEFQTPRDVFRMERSVRPRVVKEEATYSKRIGASVAVRKVVAQDEWVSVVTLYRWDDALPGWREVQYKNFLS